MGVVLLLLFTVLAPSLSTITILTKSDMYTVISPITESGDTITAQVSSATGPIAAFDPQAKIIWNLGCDPVLVFSATFTIPCGADFNIISYGTADTSKVDGSSSNQTFTIPAADLAGGCSTNVTNIDINFPFTAAFATSHCVPGTTGVGFIAFSGTIPPPPSCPPGCPTCTSDWLNCTSCQQHSYRVATPDATKQCPCLASFYMDPTSKLCVKCPLDLYCKTCAYDTTASAPKCASCNCAQHRTFNATTKTCDCDATHHQDGSNAYCAKTV